MFARRPEEVIANFNQNNCRINNDLTSIVRLMHVSETDRHARR